MNAEPTWMDAIIRDARRYAVVYLHLGHAFGPLREQYDRPDVTTVSVSEYLDGTFKVDSHKVIAITDVEECAASRKYGLGQLRARVHEDLDVHEAKFILVSRLARAAFPTVLGSDLLADAKHVFISPAPMGPMTGPLDSLPGWRVSGQEKEEFFASCISELSAETVIHLGEMVWDLGLSPNECLDALGALDRESLRGAGLVRMDSDSVSWVAAGDWKAFRMSIATASSRYMAVTDWLATVFVDLWVIERQVRNAIREALMAKDGAAWRSSCVSPALAEELVTRAKKDVQVRAQNIKDVRDPLEWMTTSELFDVRESRELGELGLESFMWSKLRHDLLPIRNRAAHMRVVSERDARTVGTWRKVISSKVAFDGGAGAAAAGNS